MDDVDGIERLVLAAFEKYVARIGRPPAPMTADYAELLGKDRVWVTEGDGAIIDTLVTGATPSHLLIESIAVGPTAQGCNLGRRLLERADLNARDQGLAEIRLCTNGAMTENVEFYPRRGYAETGRGIQDGYRRVFFAKRLRLDVTSRR